MLIPLVADFNASRWESWIIPVSGALCTGLALFFCWALMGSRHSTPEEKAFTQIINSEQRKAPRRPVSGVPVLISPNGDASMEGWIMNHSRGGLCVSVKQAIPVGTILTVRLSTAAAGAPTVQVRVKRCDQDLSRWVLGCRFVQVPTAQVLNRLG